MHLVDSRGREAEAARQSTPNGAATAAWQLATTGGAVIGLWDTLPTGSRTGTLGEARTR